MRLLKKCKTLRAALGGRLARMGRRGRWELSVLLGLALAALGTAVLLRPQRLRRFLRRLDARLWKWTGRRLAWSRLAGSGLLLLGSVLFLVLLAALLLRALY